MAADTLGTFDGEGVTNDYLEPKVFRKDGLLIGYCGSYRLGQLLKYYLEVPKREKDKSFDDWLNFDFVSGVKMLLKAYGNETEIYPFLVIAKGRLFRVNTDYSVLEPADLFDAIGSGAAAAKGAYSVIDNNKTPKQLLTLLVKAAARYTYSVGGRVDYLKEK